MSSIQPWNDTPSNRWAIRGLESIEMSPGLGRLQLTFDLLNRTSARIFPAYYKGTVVGIAAGYTLTMTTTWVNFGTAGKWKPSDLSGIGAKVTSLGISAGVIGISRALLTVPNVDTAPAKVSIGGFSAAFGIRVSAFYSGGEFRVLKSREQSRA